MTKILIFNLFLIPSNVFAQGLEIDSLDTNDHSNIMNVEDTSFDGSIIDTNVTFYELNDYVTYKINLKNTSRYQYTINNLTDDNSDEHIEVTYMLENNKKTVSPNESTVLMLL